MLSTSGRIGMLGTEGPRGVEPGRRGRAGDISLPAGYTMGLARPRPSTPHFWTSRR